MLHPPGIVRMFYTIILTYLNCVIDKSTHSYLVDSDDHINITNSIKGLPYGLKLDSLLKTSGPVAALAANIPF